LVTLLFGRTPSRRHGLSLRWEPLRWCRKGCVDRLAILARAYRSRRRIRQTDFGFHGKPFVLKFLNYPTYKSGMSTEALVKAAIIPNLDSSVTCQMASAA
jgi:hypothetical protein